MTYITIVGIHLKNDLNIEKIKCEKEKVFD